MKYKTDEKNINLNSSNASLLNSTQLKKKWNFKYNDNTNILGVISFSIVFGMIISNMGRKVIFYLFIAILNYEIIQFDHKGRNIATFVFSIERNHNEAC